MSRKVGWRLAFVVVLMLWIGFAGQSSATEPFYEGPDPGEEGNWCDRDDCYCSPTQDGLRLISWACGCDSRGTWRTCTYGE